MDMGGSARLRKDIDYEVTCTGNVCQLKLGRGVASGRLTPR